MASIALPWIQLLAAFGALQGILLACVLVAHRKNRTANRLLAALMVSFSLYLGSSAIEFAGLVRALPHFIGVGYQTPLVFGPLVYLYAVAASDRSWRFTRRTALHFVPLAVSVAATAHIYMMSGAEKLALYDRIVAGDVPTVLVVLDPLKYVSGIAYSAATVLYLRAHRRRVEDSYSNTARVNLVWLLWLAGAGAAIWLLATVLRIADVGVRDEHVTLAIALLVYSIGYAGLKQPEVFRYETAEYPVPVRLVAAEPPASPPRYERPALADGEAAQLERRLIEVMESERPWADSELTLSDLAARLDSTPHKLSELLNAQIGKSFYDFVNGYRVREVQRRIQAGEARTRKMLALALDAGFASKSTFNEAFKKHTLQTPSDFRQAVGA
ncbi:MAG TPA: helix-turn-helix domain-containing protein [Gemmatimonadaceae bacterium]|nr:helix-turn-helix domain-containing protein [Gemmatimonadaceae bacterium]